MFISFKLQKNGVLVFDETTVKEAYLHQRKQDTQETFSF